mmetsp:Transcript_22762/g.21963  ORF Transcript_22762/g.21963 Transcript_22762/m.21963 type:complete len:294 (-) Transcript_22762:235-1116(-)
MDDDRLDNLRNLLESIGKSLLTINFKENVGTDLGEDRNYLGVMEELDLLGQDRRRKVVRVLLPHIQHSFLASVFGALYVEDLLRHGAVLEEKLGLNLILREVFDEDPGVDLIPEFLDQDQGLGLIILVQKAFVLQKSLEVHQLHIRSFCESRAKSCLARAFGSNHEENLRHHGLLGLLVHIIDRPKGIDPVHLSELLVQIHHRLRSFIEILKSFEESVRVIIASAASLGPRIAPLHQHLLTHVIEDHILALAHILLEVDCLICGSWESIDQIVFGGIGNETVDKDAHCEFTRD